MSTPVKAGIGMAAVLVLAVAFWLIRPLFVDSVVDEEFPMAAGAEIPDDMTIEEVEAEMEAAADAAPVQVTEDMPGDGPTALVSGTFVDADDFHQGSGSATIYDLGDGSRVLRLEDFEVTNGPDLHVYLVPLNADGAPEVTADAVDLGALKGNIGDQNYDIPADVDTDQPLGIVIHCVAFSVEFATAALA